MFMEAHGCNIEGYCYIKHEQAGSPVSYYSGVIFEKHGIS